MPLPDDRADRIRRRLNHRLPPVSMGVATTMGATFTVDAYLNDSRGALDALGQPDREAVLYLAPTQATLAPGHEIDSRWVVWTDARTEDGWTVHDLRRLPNFSTWTRVRRTAAGRDPDTGAPLFTDATADIDAYLVQATLDSEEPVGRIDNNATGTLLIKGGTAVLELGDRLTHPDFGAFRVAGVAPYGPWASANVEAA